MRLPEMLVNGLDRFIPINKTDLAVLKGELTDKYFTVLNSIKMKDEKNAPIIKEIEAENEKLQTLDPHAPEFEQTLNRMDILTEKLNKKTFIEKGVDFLEKPLVRVTLMVGFLIFSRWLFKKMTEKPKEDLQDVEETVEQPQPYFNQGFNPYGNQFYPQQPFYPQNPNQQFQQSQRR